MWSVERGRSRAARFESSWFIVRAPMIVEVTPGLLKVLEGLVWETRFVAATKVTSGSSHPRMEVNQGSVPADPGLLP
jgi:hypothetical protein